jgi:hypothetical protein
MNRQLYEEGSSNIFCTCKNKYTQIKLKEEQN